MIPALLRAAAGSYGAAIIRELMADGFDDVPRNGPYVLGGMANQALSSADLMLELGITKQAASQLIDTLVVHGYLERTIDPIDRRRTTITITLTARDRVATAAVRSGCSTSMQQRR